MNAFELARLPRIALMAEFMRVCAPLPSACDPVAAAMRVMTREALVTAILRKQEPPPGPLPKRVPAAPPVLLGS